MILKVHIRLDHVSLLFSSNNKDIFVILISTKMVVSVDLKFS